jgi:type III secretory pathway component EscR
MSSDEILEYFVQRVEETGIGKNITLCVNGLVVTGYIIRAKMYYDIMSTIDNNEVKLTNDQIELETMDKSKEHYKEFMLQLRNKHTENSHSPKYIHLRNVKIYSSDVLSIPFPTELWRGKLSSVDGFSLGIAEVNQALQT